MPFVNIFFKIQNIFFKRLADKTTLIDQPTVLSVTNWERESVLDFVLHVVIIALISIFSLFFFSWKTELDKSSSSIAIFALSPRKSERPRARYRQIEAGWHIELDKLVSSSVAQKTKLIPLSPRKSERPRARYRQIEAGWHIELDKLVSSSVAQKTKLIPNFITFRNKAYFECH